MQTLWQDLRYGVRMLKKNPGFTAVAVLTLAVAIGANAVVFSVMDGLILRALNLPQAQSLHIIERAGDKELIVAVDDLAAVPDQGAAKQDGRDAIKYFHP